MVVEAYLQARGVTRNTAMKFRCCTASPGENGQSELMLKGKVAFYKALSNKWFPMDKRAAAGLWMLEAWRLYLVGEGRLRS